MVTALGFGADPKTCTRAVRIENCDLKNVSLLTPLLFASPPLRARCAASGLLVAWTWHLGLAPGLGTRAWHLGLGIWTWLPFAWRLENLAPPCSWPPPAAAGALRSVGAAVCVALGLGWRSNSAPRCLAPAWTWCLNLASRGLALGHLAALAVNT
jgi:hypothetical protein